MAKNNKPAINKTVETPIITEKSARLMHIQEFGIIKSLRPEILQGFKTYAESSLGKLYNTLKGWETLYSSYITRKI